MKVLAIESKDIYVTLQFSVTQIQNLLDFIDKCVVEYDSAEEPEFEAKDLYVKQMAKTLDELVEGIEKGTIS